MQELEALLEWASALEVLDRRPQRVEDLADGELLLQVMRDVNPEAFQRPGRRLGVLEPQLQALLSGLVEHFSTRPGSGEATARKMLDRASRIGRMDASELTSLVIWATLDHDLPSQARYVQTCQGLSEESGRVIMMITERYCTPDAEPRQSFGGSQHGSQPPSPMARSEGRCSEPGLSPMLSGASPHPSSSGGLQDFLEVGLDAESRFRRLKEHYIALKEEQERWEEERASLRSEIEAERTKRQEAEESERDLRLELRSSEDARDRVKEECRAVFELRLEQEVAHTKDALKRKDDEAETLREELELARVQAQSAKKYQSQLDIFKKKLEECQAWKREKEELRQQLDELVNSKQTGSGGVDHLHSRLASLRDEVSMISRERDEAQLQVRALQSELELATSSMQGSSAKSQQPRSHLDDEDTEGPPPGEILAGATGMAQDGSEALLERLLAEKERATRAETTLQLKQAEVTSLNEQRSKDLAQIASIEAQLQLQKEAATSQGGSAPSQGSSEAAQTGAIRELQNQLTLRERELQVHQWRGKAESSAHLAQETLMASCVHELGLRYQKLKVQHDLLLKRLSKQGEK